MYYFYCPNCGHEEVVGELPRGYAVNIRDGWGRPIYHYECPSCHNLDAGFMSYDAYKEPEEVENIKEYSKHVIGMYQGIRGIKD